MQSTLITLLASLLVWLPTVAAAATTATIHAEWTSYTAPSGYTVTGYKLYQEGSPACQASSASATSLDCTVTLASDTTNFTLTAVFSNGTESPHSAPFPFTVQSQTATPLKAVITSTTLNGSAPLSARFDAASSTGTIASYLWAFGDGATATGSSASHTYTTAGTYTAKLTITGTNGNTSTATTTVVVQAVEQTADMAIEAGEVAVSHNWVRVNFDSPFTNPIVVVGPPRVKGSDPCVVRIRNVTSTGFDARIYEWNYLDGSHVVETVNYLVVEKGRTTLPDGSVVEAGTFTGTTSFKTVSFNGSFAKTPVVMTTIASVNEADTISGRLRNTGLTGFQYYFREQEKNTNNHANETVHYLAWEPGRGTIGAVQYEVATTATKVTNAWYTQTLQGTYGQAPMVLADMQTTNNTDTSALRFNTITTTGVEVKVEEERSKDTEVNHPAEAVGYFIFDTVADN